ncbi:hypothetical protein ABGN05_29515 [Aquibium sp. LZ166]|uniref:Uncharacterized protein n=1 Tax=Aquibium pacificus TaxID=3153579 RepID=A0ABV3SSI4_9HYPH
MDRLIVTQELGGLTNAQLFAMLGEIERLLAEYAPGTLRHRVASASRANILSELNHRRTFHHHNAPSP